MTAEKHDLAETWKIISIVDKTEAEFHSMSNVVSGDIYIGGGETRQSN
ncbi:MAG: hypothetical protein ACLVJ6_10600 [Merdibacter sp.]